MATVTSRPSTEQTEQREFVPLFHVVLLDDDDHTYDYVVEMLERLFCMDKSKAFQHAVEVDSSGRTVLITCERPAAEFARDQVHGYGADWRMARSKGSMKAILKPAPAP